MSLKPFFSLLFFSVILLTSCGEDDDNAIDGLGNSYFTATIDGKDYKYPCATSNGQNASGRGIMVLSSAGSSYDSGYGVYSGGALTLTYNLHGEGEYTITTDAGLVSSPMQKLMSISSTLGIGTQIGYRFVSQTNSGKANVTIVDGKYHVTISSPVVLKKSIVVGGTPTQTIPETINLTLENGYVK